MREVGERKLDGRNLILDSTTPKVMSGWISSVGIQDSTTPKVMSGWIGWISSSWIQDYTS